MKNKSSIFSKVYRKIRLFFFKNLGLEPKFLGFYETYRCGKKYKNKEQLISISDKKFSCYVNNLGNIGNQIDRVTLYGENDTGLVRSIYYPEKTVVDTNVYISQIPNEGAGIGHQIANYNCGLHLALKYEIGHAYVPFKNEKWDYFLGFGQDEPTINDLKKQGYKVKKLPSISIMGHDMLDAIVAYYKQSGDKVILLTQIDEFYGKQYGVIPYIKRKFETADARKGDSKLLGQHAEILLHKLDGDYINVAVHIRRGDINSGQTSGDKQLTMRWLGDEYYQQILQQLSEKYKDKAINIFLFSQGNKKDFKDYEKYGKVYYCIDMPPMESFIHMVRADILVTSKSSFSYKPALLSDGIRICPSGFWHGYPEDEKWIVASEEGEIGLK